MVNFTVIVIATLGSTLYLRTTKITKWSQGANYLEGKKRDITDN